jgi:hypothetical protein
MTATHKHPLSDFFDSAKTAPPLLSEAEVLAAISRSGGGNRTPFVWFPGIFENKLILAGAVMVILTLIIGMISLFSPDHTGKLPTSAPAISGQQNRNESSPGERQNFTEHKEQHTAASVEKKQSWRAVRVAREDSFPATGFRMNDNQAAPVGDIPIVHLSDFIEKTKVGERFCDVPPSSLEPIAESSSLKSPWLSTNNPDSLKKEEDSTADFSGLFAHGIFMTRSFSQLNQSLAKAGYPTVSDNGWATGLSFEFPKTFHLNADIIPFLFPPVQYYYPGITIEWMKKPEAVSYDGKNRVSLSSWSIFLDNSFYLYGNKNMRLVWILGIGFNWTNLVVSKNDSFDNLLLSPQDYSMSLTQFLPLFLRPALKYDYVFKSHNEKDEELRLYFGATAGYTFSSLSAETTGGWNTRSVFDIGQGNSVSGGPADKLNGWYLGFHFSYAFM